MTVHDYAHLHDHRAHLDRLAAARARNGATAVARPHPLRATVSAVARALGGRRVAGGGATHTRRLADVRGR